MPMMTCDQQKLADFLEDRLTGLEEESVVAHLDHCDHCREFIQDQAASLDAWAEVTELLGDWRREKVSSSVALPLRGVLDSLKPTDDPSMLGRLGSYEISGVVGTGGMGVVLKALDRSLDRIVAIKVMAPHLATSPSARRRFARESKAAAAVLHPNVIAIHSVASDHETPFLVMPYIRGISLQKRLDQEGALPIPEILRIGHQIASGLAAAHAQGLVHRDIKPANVLLEEGVERVAITDFGLARAVDDASVTCSGVIAGTPQFMSPEQACGNAVDQRSDLFSLGSVLYAMCTGRTPFQAETTYGVLRRIIDEEPPEIQKLNPDVPDWLCCVIRKLHAKPANERYDSAATVAKILEACLAHLQSPETAPLPDEVKPDLRLREATGDSRIRYLARLQPGLVGILVLLGALVFCTHGIGFKTADLPDIGGHWKGNSWGHIRLDQTSPGEYVGTFTESGQVAAGMNWHGAGPHVGFSHKIAVATADCKTCHVGNAQDLPPLSTGTIHLRWSPREQRFNGSWNDGVQRFGKLSLQVEEGALSGTRLRRDSGVRSAEFPQLTDLLWERPNKGDDEPPADELIEPTERR